MIRIVDFYRDRGTSPRIRLGLIVSLLLSSLVWPAYVSSNPHEHGLLADAVQAMCPEAWEDLAQDLDGGVSDPWAGNEADRQAFIDFLTTIENNVPLSQSEAQSLSTDPEAVLKECAAARNALFAASVFRNSADAEALANALLQDGSAPERAVESCRALKDGAPGTPSGAYWIDPDGDQGIDPVQAFCEMAHDGGGWMLFARLGTSANGINLFQEQKGTYDSDVDSALATTANFSLGDIGRFADTEMIFTLDTPDFEVALGANKYGRYRYHPSDLMFNRGPITCVVGGEYEFSADGVAFHQGGKGACSTTSWYPVSVNPSRYVVLLSKSNYGAYWGAAIGGNNSWRHAAWIYIR